MSTDAAETPTTDALDTAAVEDKSQSTQAPPEGTSATTTEESPEFFSDKFDPSTLDETLRPAYDGMRKAFTQKTQELAEQRKQVESVNALITDLRSEDPGSRRNALAWLAQNGLDEQDVAEVFGWEIEPDPDQEPPDPEQPMTRAEFEAWQAEQAAREQQAAQEAAQQQWAESEDQRINAELDELGGGKLSPRARDQIFYSALGAAQRGLTEGLDIKRAFEEYEAEWTDRQKSWRDGKATVQPTAAGGLTATEAPDMDTHEARVAWMVEQAQAGLNAQ